jgi:hypothetical protein
MKGYKFSKILYILIPLISLLNKSHQFKEVPVLSIREGL